MYVGNLHFKINEDQLKQLFAAYGEVTSVKVVFDRETQRSKGFGFVEMANAEEAKVALQELNGKDVMGRALKVDEAQERAQAPRSEGGYRPQRSDNSRNFRR